MKRVEDSSGARYTAHKEQPRRFEPIAPVGTNYTPVGKVDMNEMRKTTTKPVAATKPVSESSSAVCNIGELIYALDSSFYFARSFITFCS